MAKTNKQTIAKTVTKIFIQEFVTEGNHDAWEGTRMLLATQRDDPALNNPICLFDL